MYNSLSKAVLTPQRDARQRTAAREFTLNTCNKMTEDNKTCDSIVAGVQIALFSDGQC